MTTPSATAVLDPPDDPMGTDPMDFGPDFMPPADPDAVDPDAPYGRRSDGTPKAKPGRRPRAGSAPRAPEAKPAAKGPSKPPGARKAPPRPPRRPDYRPGILGLLSLPVGVLGAGAAGLNRPDLMADAATVALGAGPVADALNDLAAEEPRIAAVLDWVLTAGPYGALVSALVPMFAQLGANHGLIRPGVLGTRDPGQLVAEFVDRQGRGDSATG